MQTVIARMDKANKGIIVKFPDGREKTFGTVLLTDCEWGAGMIRGKVVEVFAYPIPSRKIVKRAHVPEPGARWTDSRNRREILTETKGAYLTGSDVFYI